MIESAHTQESGANEEYEKLILEFSRKMRSLETKDDVNQKKQALEYLGAAFYNAEFRKNLFKNLPVFFQELKQNTADPKAENVALLFKENLLVAAVVAEIHQIFAKNRGYSLLDIEDHVHRLCPTENDQQKSFLNHVVFQAIDHLAKLSLQGEMAGQLDQERIKVMDVMLGQQKTNLEFQPCPRNEKKLAGSPSPSESSDHWHDELDSYKKPLNQFLDRMSGLAQKLHKEKRTDLFAHIWVEKIGDPANPQYALKTFGLTTHPPAGEDEIGFDRTPVEMTVMLTKAEAYELLRLEQFGASAKELVKQKAEALLLQKTFSSKAAVGSWSDWEKRSEPSATAGLPLSSNQPFHMMIHGWGGIPFVWDEQIDETVKQLANLGDPSLENQIWCSFGLQGSMSSTPDCLFTADGYFDRQKLKDFQEEDLLFQPTQAFLEITRSLHRIHQRSTPIRNAEGNLVVMRSFTTNEYSMDDLIALEKLSKAKEGFFVPTGKIDFSLAEADLFHETLRSHASIVEPALEKITNQLHNLDFEIFEFFHTIYGFPLEQIKSGSPVFAAIENWRKEYFSHPEQALNREKLDELAKVMVKSAFFDQNGDFTELFSQEVALTKTGILESKREVVARKIIDKVRQNQFVTDAELKIAADTIAYYYQSNDRDFAMRLLRVLKNQRDGKINQGNAAKLWSKISQYLDKEPPVKSTLKRSIETILNKNGITLAVDVTEEIDQLWELLLADGEVQPETEKELTDAIIAKIQAAFEQHKTGKVEEFMGSIERSLNIWGERTRPLQELLTKQQASINKTEDYWKENLEKILFERTANIDADLALFTTFKAKYPDQADDPVFLRRQRPELGYRIDQLKNLAKLAGWDINDYGAADGVFLQNLVIKHNLSLELDEPRLFSLAEISIKQHTLASLSELFGHSMGGKLSRALARGLRPNSVVKPSPLAQLYRSLNVSPNNLQFIASNEVIHGSRLTDEEEAKAVDWMGEQRKDMVTLHSRAVGGFLVEGKSILTNPLIGAIGKTFGIERAVLLWYLGEMKTATPLLMHEYVYQKPDQLQQQIGSWLLRNMPFFISDEATLDEDRWLTSRGIVVPQIGMDDNILWPGDGVIGNRLVGVGDSSIAISAGLNHYPEADEIGRALAVMRLLRGNAVLSDAGLDPIMDWAKLKAIGSPEKGISPEEMTLLFPRLKDLEPKDVRSGIPSPDVIIEQIKAKLPKRKAKVAKAVEAVEEVSQSN